MSTSYRDLILKQDLNLGTTTKTRRNPGGGTMTGNQINLATFARGGAATTTTWDPSSIASGAEEAKEITVNGATLGDHVSVSFDKDLSDCQLTASVTTTNTVTAVISNSTGAAVDLASGTLSVLVFAVP